MLNESGLIKKALDFAIKAHGSINQKRKYTGEDYIVHPIKVAEIVKAFGGSEIQIAAALLHDTVEDTPVTLNDIQENFGDKVRDLVFWLTDVSQPSDGNRATRKAIDRAHIAKAPLEAQVIKCADLIHNTQSITKYDSDFAKVYMREKKLILEAMPIKDHPIHKKASKLICQYYEKQVDELSP